MKTQLKERQGMTMEGALWWAQILVMKNKQDFLETAKESRKKKVGLKEKLLVEKKEKKKEQEKEKEKLQEYRFRASFLGHNVPVFHR